MPLNIELWQLLGALSGLCAAWLAVLFGAGKLLLNQFESRLDDRFNAQEISRSAAQQHWNNQFAHLEQTAINEAKEWQRIERELMSMKADLPVNYVRREDYIRNQSVIESKLDGLAVRIENAILKGGRNG